MKPRICLRSFLRPDIERFIAHKRSFGRRFVVEEKSLALLDDYLATHGIGALCEVTPAMIDNFLLSRPRRRPRSYNHLRCTIVRMFAYLVDQGRLAKSPVQSPARRSRYERTPYIFDADHASRLLAIAQTFVDKGGTVDRGKTYYAIFAILYGLGLRVSEVCNLRIEDADFDRRLLNIRETKFYKSRLVPFGPKLHVLLGEYLRQKATRRPGECAPGQPLFCLRGGRPINPGTISQTFHHLLPRLRLDIPPGTSPPRLHDLRHSCAHGALMRWYRLGLDPQARLLTLATFLGHVDVNSTAVYLTTTPDLLDQANRRFEAFAAKAMAEELPS
jgi:integrase